MKMDIYLKNLRKHKSMKENIFLHLKKYGIY